MSRDATSDATTAPSGAGHAIRVLGIAGSLRAASYNRQLLEAMRALAPDDIEFDVFEDLRLVEPFDEDLEPGVHPGADALRAAIRRSHAVLVSTPEYNSSIPGQLKNAMDWLSRPDGDVPGLQGSALYGRPVAVVSASNGQFGAVWAAEELRKSLKAQGARVVSEPQVAIGGAATAFEVTGDGAVQLTHADTERRLIELVDALVEQARALVAAGIELVPTPAPAMA